MIQEIKNLSIININKIIKESINNTNLYCLNNDIKNSKDTITLFKHFFYTIFLNAYSKHTKVNIILYYFEEELLESSTFKSILNLLKNKFKFPTIITNIPLEDYIKLISSDSPEYDEAINNNFNLIDSFSLLKGHLKKSGLLFLNKKYKNLKEQIGLLLSSKS